MLKFLQVLRTDHRDGQNNTKTITLFKKQNLKTDVMFLNINFVHCRFLLIFIELMYNKLELSFVYYLQLYLIIILHILRTIICYLLRKDVI